MKQNPCRYCALTFVHNGIHSPSWSAKCAKCENITKHREYVFVEVWEELKRRIKNEQ